VRLGFVQAKIPILTYYSQSEAGEDVVVLAVVDEVHQADEASPEAEVGVCAAELDEEPQEVHRVGGAGLAEEGLAGAEEAVDEVADEDTRTELSIKKSARKSTGYVKFVLYFCLSFFVEFATLGKSHVLVACPVPSHSQSITHNASLSR
jgi:hypothetical protein